jgi:hypothetical protein
MIKQQTMKRIVYLFLVLILNACIAQPAAESTPTVSAPFVIKSADNPYAPRLEDISMQIGGVELTSLDLAERVDSTPVRVELGILGLLPRACDELRVDIAAPNDQYEIFVKVYSLVNPNVECENVFQQFEASVLLGVYSTGRYTVWVNGGLVGDFVAY